jgi:hypothetical protein
MSVQSYYARSTGNGNCFVRIKRHEGVGIKARGMLQSICNTKIRRNPYFHDYPDIVMTDITKIPVFLNFAGEIPLCTLWQHVKYEIRVRFGSWRSEHDRNISSLYKIDLLRIGVILFWGYNGFITDFYWFSKKMTTNLGVFKYLSAVSVCIVVFMFMALELELVLVEDSRRYLW